MDTTPAMMVLSPILLPVALSLGLSAIHFGIIMVVNLAIGFITPPLGINLFVAARVGNTSLETVCKGIVIFIIVMLFCLLCITYIPAISETLPQAGRYARISAFGGRKHENLRYPNPFGTPPLGLCRDLKPMTASHLGRTRHEGKAATVRLRGRDETVSDRGGPHEDRGHLERTVPRGLLPRRPGHPASAIAGIDQALWDIKGKFLQRPVYDLLGGPEVDSMRVPIKLDRR